MLAPHTPCNDPLYNEYPRLDATDRKIISATQGGLPLVAQPYSEIAAQLGLDVGDLLARMRHMQQQGIIRRIGIVPNHYKLGFKANGMSVWNVRDTHIDTLGELVGALNFVSHCYRRPRYLPDWPYNLFAMVHGRDREEVRAKVSIIAELLGEDCQGHEVLYSTRILKKTGLRIAVP